MSRMKWAVLAATVGLSFCAQGAFAQSVTVSTIGPSGPAAGDLSGTYPNPTVAKASNGFAVTGNVTVTGSAIFSTTTSYVCTATDTTSNSAVKATPASASSVSFSGADSDVVAYQCVGN